jgi:membrane glycosyltransferase
MCTNSKIAIYEFVVTTLTTLGVFGYVISKFVYYGNIWWLVLCTMSFAYLFRSIVEIYMAAFVCLFTRTRILPRRDFSSGIPPDHKAALVYCVRAAHELTVTKAISSMETSLRGNQDENLLAIYLSDTHEWRLVIEEINQIKGVQDAYGASRVFYFHRKNNWGKKWGAYQDLMAWLSGSDYPIAYLGKKHGRYKRDQNQRLFSLELIDSPVDDTLLTREEKETGIIGNVDALERNSQRGVKYLLISDADVIWPPGTAINIIEKMAHESNEQFALFQPSIGIGNAEETLYTKVLSWCRELSKFTTLAIWKVYDSSFFYGKGGIKVQQYLATMLERDREVLPASALSHDYIEARYLRTAYLPDIQIMEDEPHDYFENLKRLQRWLTGDLIALWHEVVLPMVRMIDIARNRSTGLYAKPRPIEGSGRLLLRVVCRFVFSPSVFALFLFLTMLGGSLPGLYLTAEPRVELALLSFALAGIVLVPRIVGPVASFAHLRKRGLRRILVSLIIAPIECMLTTLLFLQQLIDHNIALLKSVAALWASRRKGKELAWEVATEQLTPVEAMSYWTVYKKRAIAVALGLALPLFLFFTQPLMTVWYSSPIWLSFLLGPALAKLTAKGKQCAISSRS